MTLTTDFFDGNNQPFGNQLILKGLPAAIKFFFQIWLYSSLSKGGRLEAGVAKQLVSNDNLVSYVRWDGSKWIDDNRSNHFIYDENINAAYVNVNKQVKKWSFQGGLRLENTVAKDTR